MSRKLTKEEFVKQAREKHGDKYDYSKVEYKNCKERVCIICKEKGHGEFYQTPGDHLNGSGCPKCKKITLGNRFRKTLKEFIRDAREVHGDRYNYSKVDYKNGSAEVCIICPEHGEFYRIANHHLISSGGCPSCSPRISTALRFIETSKKIHRDKYDYSKVEYKGANDKVCIVCPHHGEFFQRAADHIKGSGCAKCSGRIKSTTKSFVEKAKEIHGDRYNYSKVDYKNSTTPVEIFCKVHGYFSQTPKLHLRGSGCQKCNSGFPTDSKLSLLSDSDVEQLSTHQLIELIGQNLLPADFRVLTKTAGGSSERKDDINKLRESIGSGVEEDETAEEEQVLQEEQLDFEDAQTIAADDQSESLLNVLPDLVTKELTTYDKYFVSSGEKGAYLLKESVNKIWNCVLSSESYL